MNVFGLIPASGLSTRMGRPKLSLLLGNRTVLERVVDCLRAAGIEQIVVVIGPHVPELIDLARGAGATALPLERPTPDMRSTIEAGLQWIEATWRPTTADAFLLAPADHPALIPSVVKRLLAEPSDEIVVPTHQGKRGHPTRIGWRHVAHLFNLPTDRGLNSYLRSHPESVREVPVDAAEILDDLDTPEDYERWLARFEDDG